jgi:6-phosphogluconolactonase
VFISHDNRHVLVADLGTDEVVAYTFEASSGAISAPQSFKMQPGAGPRHFVFHPSARYVYVINELDSTIATLTFDPVSGRLALLQVIPALPPGTAAESHGSGVQITPDGRHLYAANRGHDSLAMYAVDLSTGKLSLIGHQSVLGRTPRDFTIHPSGRLLVVANQDSDALTVFRIDQQTGKLTDTGQRGEIGTPMCAKFARF